MMRRLAVILVVALTIALVGCKGLGPQKPDNQLALGHLVAPQIAMSVRGEDLIVISFAERQPQQQTLVPLAKMRTRGWTIGAPYGLRTDGDEYWLQPLSEAEVTPRPAPTQQPAPAPSPAQKPSAHGRTGGK